ncbi:hypothetical protein [Cylindrospermopsis raciborskii]|nr:hypothetical protein [Cylindrospermopsis raciborskii]
MLLSIKTKLKLNKTQETLMAVQPLIASAKAHSKAIHSKRTQL